jgi:hypothetical protein
MRALLTRADRLRKKRDNEKSPTMRTVAVTLAL